MASHFNIPQDIEGDISADDVISDDGVVAIGHDDGYESVSADNLNVEGSADVTVDTATTAEEMPELAGWLMLQGTSRMLNVEKQRVILLEGCTVAPAGGVQSREHSIIIHHPRRGNRFLGCAGEADEQQWLDILIAGTQWRSVSQRQTQELTRLMAFEEEATRREASIREEIADGATLSANLRRQLYSLKDKASELEAMQQRLDEAEEARDDAKEALEDEIAARRRDASEQRHERDDQDANGNADVARIKARLEMVEGLLRDAELRAQTAESEAEIATGKLKTLTAHVDATDNDGSSTAHNAASAQSSGNNSKSGSRQKMSPSKKDRLAAHAAAVSANRSSSVVSDRDGWTEESTDNILDLLGSTHCSTSDLTNEGVDVDDEEERQGAKSSDQNRPNADNMLVDDDEGHPTSDDAQAVAAVAAEHEEEIAEMMHEIDELREELRLTTVDLDSERALSMELRGEVERMEAAIDELQQDLAASTQREEARTASHVKSPSARRERHVGDIGEDDDDDDDDDDDVEGCDSELREQLRVLNIDLEEAVDAKEDATTALAASQAKYRKTNTALAVAEARADAAEDALQVAMGKHGDGDGDGDGGDVAPVVVTQTVATCRTCEARVNTDHDSVQAMPVKKKAALSHNEAQTDFSGSLLVIQPESPCRSSPSSRRKGEQESHVLLRQRLLTLEAESLAGAQQCQLLQERVRGLESELITKEAQLESLMGRLDNEVSAKADALNRMRQELRSRDEIARRLNELEGQLESSHAVIAEMERARSHRSREIMVDTRNQAVAQPRLSSALSSAAIAKEGGAVTVTVGVDDTQARGTSEGNVDVPTDATTTKIDVMTDVNEHNAAMATALAEQHRLAEELIAERALRKSYERSAMEKMKSLKEAAFGALQQRENALAEAKSSLSALEETCDEQTQEVTILRQRLAVLQQMVNSSDEDSCFVEHKLQLAAEQRDAQGRDIVRLEGENKRLSAQLATLFGSLRGMGMTATMDER